MPDKEYIERWALMDEIHRIGGHNLCEWSTIGVKALVDRQPTTDVVEVVQCKDCRHRLDDGRCYKGIYAISAGYKMTNAYDYCSYGERKEQQ